MDKPFNFLLICLTIFCIVFFIYKSLSENNVVKQAEAKDKSWRYVIKDPLYGCEYLSRLKGGFTPRLTPEGKHAGCNDSSASSENTK